MGGVGSNEIIFKCAICEVPGIEESGVYHLNKPHEGDVEFVCRRCTAGLLAFNYSETVLINALHYVMNEENNDA